VPADPPGIRRSGTRVENAHRRRMPASKEQVGELLDSLSSPGDRLWPSERWPPMCLDGPLGVGARGGHGPIRYLVEEYEPGSSVTFRFTAPKGFHGTHGFEVVRVGGGSELRHEIRMRVTGLARMGWPLVFGPLHDALMEDCLEKAEATLSGRAASPPRWPFSVRLLRALVRWGRRLGVSRR
jgi:hypothetical protein